MGVGVRPDPGLLAAHVRAAAAGDEPGDVDGVQVEAITFLGGVPSRLVPGNLRTGVDKPDLGDAKTNLSYGDVGVLAGVAGRANQPKAPDQSRLTFHLLKTTR